MREERPVSGNAMGSGHLSCKTVRTVVRLGGLVLVVLGLAKWSVAAGLSDGFGPESGARLVVWRIWAALQGAVELAGGAAVWFLSPRIGSAALVALGGAFVLWTVWDPPTGLPCPCLAGLMHGSGHVREHSWEWRLVLGSWLFLMGFLGHLALNRVHESEP